MKKILVILLCLFTVLSMLTTSSMSSQRNAWKNEAEKAWKDKDKLKDEYDSYQEEMKEKIDSLTAERDAFSLLSQAIEAENAQLKQDMESLILNAQDTTAGLEEQLIQANADKAWAEQRLQEALDVLLTPVPSSMPESTPAVMDTPVPVDFFLDSLDLSPLTDKVMTLFALPIPDSVSDEEEMQETVPSPSPVPAETPLPEESMEEVTE